MKRNTKSLTAVTATVLLVLCLAQVMAPPILEGWDESECTAAYIRCLFAAGVSGVANVIFGAGMASFCTVGLAWCKEFAA
ncbi:MAG: hypothetical protein JXB26_03940 [Candidatus Aminicenantes bacterium]|nr:hypothetical protein [Candidatus Aminicenantes bacterium]